MPFNFPYEAFFVCLRKLVPAHMCFFCIPFVFSPQGILHDMVRQKMLDIVITRMSHLFSNVEDMLKMGRPPEPLYVSQPANGELQS